MSSVTIEQVQAAIKGETYTVLPDGRTTICQLTLDNGFTVDGKSACVSIANFNEALGNKYSREDAVSKVWAFLGFRLADELSKQTTNPLKGAESVRFVTVGSMEIHQPIDGVVWMYDTTEPSDGQTVPEDALVELLQEFYDARF